MHALTLKKMSGRRPKSTGKSHDKKSLNYSSSNSTINNTNIKTKRTLNKKT